MNICDRLDEHLSSKGRYKDKVSVVCEPDKDRNGEYLKHKGYIPIEDNGLTSYKMDTTRKTACVDGLNFNSSEIYMYEAKATILIDSKKIVPEFVRFTDESKVHKYSYLLKYYNILEYFVQMDNKIVGTDDVITGGLKKGLRNEYENMEHIIVLFIDSFYNKDYVETQDNLAAIASLIKAIRRYFVEVNNDLNPLTRDKGNGKSFEYKCSDIQKIKVVIRRSTLCNAISKYY
ncbi:MAG: hypothetical protein ACRC6T_08345 [Sarcina sp.]